MYIASARKISKCTSLSIDEVVDAELLMNQPAALFRIVTHVIYFCEWQLQIWN